MGNSVSIIDSAAGKSVVDNVYITTVNTELSCIGYSLDKKDKLMNVWIQPREHTRPDQYVKNKGGFRVLIKPGIKMRLIQFIEESNFELGKCYMMYFSILNDIPRDHIIEFNDYISRERTAPDNILWEWMNENIFYLKGWTVCLSPYQFFNFKTKTKAITPQEVLKIDSKRLSFDPNIFSSVAEDLRGEEKYLKSPRKGDPPGPICDIM